jgi:hypothetical protein
MAVALFTWFVKPQAKQKKLESPFNRFQHVSTYLQDPADPAGIYISGWWL